MHLQAIVHNVETLVCGKLFCHGTVHCVIRITRCDQIGTVSHHQSGCLEICRHFRQLELQMLVRCDGLAELLSALDILSG